MSYLLILWSVLVNVDVSDSQNPVKPAFRCAADRPALSSGKFKRVGYNINGQRSHLLNANPQWIKSQNKTPHVFDILVDKSGDGDFTSIQEAIDAVPVLRRKSTTIYIRNGIYKEKLLLPYTRTNVIMIGENVDSTIITYDDFASRKNRFGEEIGTSGSSGFFVNGEGFVARNITFSNTAGPVGQAVAVRIDADKVVFVNCKFLGYQDTLYLHGKQSRQYYKNCLIVGTTDFIFGWSTAVFEDCTIVSRQGGRYITAASTEQENPYGMIFLHCTFTGQVQERSVYLGRPWRPYARTILINCFLGKHIIPDGWHNWDKPEAEKSTYYAEYNSSGPGADPERRVGWSHQLTKKESDQYLVAKVLGGEDDWNPLELLKQ